MKNDTLNLIRLLATVFILSPVSAFADTTSDADGIAGADLVYSGTILDEPTCRITKSPDSVALGTWMTSASSGLGSGLYSTNGATSNVTYEFTANCDAALNVQFKITATAGTVQCTSSNSPCLSLDSGTGQATGVGVYVLAGPPFVIAGSGNSNYLNVVTMFTEFYPNSSSSSRWNYPTTLAKGNNTLYFAARYIQTADAITTGTGNASATITFRFTKG